MKFATKPIWHHPPRFRYVAAIPWEIRNSNFCRHREYKWELFWDTVYKAKSPITYAILDSNRSPSSI